MDIFITKDDFQTLMDIIIIDQTCTDMVQWTSTTTTHESMMAIKKKTQSYVEQTLGDDFTPLVIEMYGCFHFRFDSFLITCAHIVILRH
jgi:hypothetical protein